MNRFLLFVGAVLFIIAALAAFFTSTSIEDILGTIAAGLAAWTASALV